VSNAALAAEQKAIADGRVAAGNIVTLAAAAGAIDTSSTAELSPAFGSALLGIVDDADVRAKAAYLQG
jgi:hypothetical protein